MRQTPPAQQKLIDALLSDDTNADSRLLREIRDQSRGLLSLADKMRLDFNAPRPATFKMPPGIAAAEKRLTALFNRVSFSETYKDWVADRLVETAYALADNEEFRTGITGWAKSTAKHKIEIAMLVGETQQTMFCDGIIDKTPVAHVSWLPASSASVGTHRAPLVDGDPHLLLYRVDAKSPLRNCADAMETFFHENLHLTQSVLAFAFERGALAGHPLERDARLHFLTVMDQSAYIDGIPSLYMAHPSERDTWENAPAFVEILRDALKPHGMKL